MEPCDICGEEDGIVVYHNTVDHKTYLLCIRCLDKLLLASLLPPISLN